MDTFALVVLAICIGVLGGAIIGLSLRGACVHDWQQLPFKIVEYPKNNEKFREEGSVFACVKCGKKLIKCHQTGLEVIQ